MARNLPTNLMICGLVMALDTTRISTPLKLSCSIVGYNIPKPAEFVVK